MRPFPLPSGFGRSLEPRERRTIAVGAIVVGVAAVFVLGVLPLGRRWAGREALIAARRERLARVESIVGREAQLAEATRALESRLDAGGTRLVRARTVALAASAVQSMVREYASASAVSVTRLDAAGSPVAIGSAVALPATLSAQGDIYGMADFLRRLQHGPWMVELTDFTIAPNPVLRGNILQVSIGLRAPIALEP
jgi:type II secretory pathway component PulM